MKNLLKCLFKFVTLFVLFSIPISVRAISELNAKVRENYSLKKAPQEDAQPNGVLVNVDEVVFVLGTSVDGHWSQVMKKSGETGWITLNLVDLYRVDRADYDDLYYVMLRERRHTTRWTWNAGLSYGPTPMGIGAESTLHYNFAKRGVFNANVDQIELASGFRYHLGADPAPALKPDGTLYNKSAKAFWEIPVYLLWMLRLGARGEWMFGPRLGFSIIKDSFNRFEYAVPGLTGFEMRYFPGDSLGFTWNVWAQMRSVIYYQTSFGLSYRF